MEKDFDNNNENCIEFLSGESSAVVSFTNKKHIIRIKKLYEERNIMVQLSRQKSKIFIMN